MSIYSQNLNGKSNPIESFFMSVGISNGIQPNFRNEISQLFYFGTLNSDFFVKNIPFSLRARISNEPFRAGQASFFKISFNPMMYKRYRINSLYDKLNDLKKIEKEKRDSLFLLESQISFLDQKIKEKKLAIPPLSIDSIPLNTSTEIGDSSLLLVQNYSNELTNKLKLLNQIQLTLTELQSNLSATELTLTNLQHQLPSGILANIQRFQLGMTSSVPSGLNGNGIPINGLSYAFTHKNWKEEGAIGITQRNMLFSNTIFDQITANSGNIFNSNEFFNNNSNRLLINHRTTYQQSATMKIGGDIVFSGKNIVKSKQQESEKTTLTTNLFAEKIIGKKQQLTLNGLIGSSTSFNDTVAKKSGASVATKFGAIYLVRSIKSKLSMNLWNYGLAYDSYSQGNFRNGSQHFDGKIQTQLKENVSVDVFYLQDQFLTKQTSIVAQQVGIGVAAKMGTVFNISGTYSLARTKAVNSSNNQLFQLTLSHQQHYRKVLVSQQLQGGKVFLFIGDTLQQVTQINHHLVVTAGKLKLGLISTYEKFQGINRLYGENIIVQPTIGFHSKLLQADMGYSFMKSEQFGKDKGMLLNIIISPSNNFYWKISGQRWLKKELIYFVEHIDPLVKPWYLTISMNLKLK